MIYEVAGAGVFGTIAQAERVKLYTFFDYLAYKRDNS